MPVCSHAVRQLWLAIVVTVSIIVFYYQFALMPTGSSTGAWPLSGIIPVQDVQNTTLGFQKIFIVNLKSRPNRRDAIALAAHLTGLDVEFVDGVTDFDEKTLPPHKPDFAVPEGFLRAWRAHMNVVRTIVEQNIQSALILEDDSDWDLRIKSQMYELAKASRILLQPQSQTQAEESRDFLPDDHSHDRSLSELNSEAIEPTTSPYGDPDKWDLLWLGHCATRFPRATDGTGSISLDRVVFPDETVPESQHIGIQWGDDQLVTQYPNHTRVVHHVTGNACTLAYGVSLPGARHMLYEMSVNKITDVLDLMMTAMCEGAEDRKKRVCLTVQPQLFQHHRPIGPKSAQSDISSHSAEYRRTAFSRNIRWSTRVNLPKLVDGETDYTDSFPDGADAVALGF